MKTIWDYRKNELNKAKHGFDFSYVKQFDWSQALIITARAPRLMAIGELDGTIVTLIFSRLGEEALSVISLRRASRKERKFYDEA